ncbi:O-methyltransferase [Halobacillus rhizosphaerae]|uniref:O-methyltransferase n=1 Tax=Halobacillus rhizosphaerae TaxID=3064889 RepID=UPI00398B35E2
MEDKNYLESLVSKSAPDVHQMEKYAEENGVPIMEPLGIHFLMQMVRIKQPKRILEVGTAIGYSALRMLEAYPDCHIVSIERDEVRYKEALENVKKFGDEGKIQIILGDALEVQQQVKKEGPYDLLFIDAAKGKYEEFFKLYSPLVTENGLIISDNVLFKGYVAAPDQASARMAKLAGKIRNFNQKLMEHPDFSTTIVPIGDGVALTVRNSSST